VSDLVEAIFKKIPMEAIHIAIGGTLSSLTAFILRIVLLGIIYTTLKNHSCLGVRIYPEALLAITLIMLGITYIPGGYLGGLYMGHKIKRRIWLVLLLSSLFGCFILILLLGMGMGYVITYNLEAERETHVPLIVPLLGLVTGTFLGGYSVDWGKPAGGRLKLILEEAAEEAEEGISLTAIKGIGPRRAERLLAAGVRTVQDLLNASPEDLSERTGIPVKTIRRLIEYVKRYIGEVESS